jgi:archaellum component FlaC
LLYHTRVTPGKGKDKDVPQIDLDEVARLIEALERDLNSIRGRSKDIQRLKDEVDTLKNVLRSPVRRHHWVRDALHDIRERFDDALDATVAEGIEVSRYVAEIGRILGL